MSIDKAKLRDFAERLVSEHQAGKGDPVPAIGVPAADVLALLAEIERLEVVAQHEIEIATERAKEVCGARMTLHALTGERDQLKAENEALRKDALRYRWLRDGCGVVEYKAIAGSIGPGMLPSGDKLQAAIDAAMAKEAPHG
ncbi:hypothetical protein [Pseudomonas sp. AE27]|uniref:hypothetical protein n=1 Tax=Pseudomonas sp. AE27 TaxID=3127460 RepID=UPI0030CA864C